MGDPSLALTFDDFRIRVAEYLGIAYLGADGTQAAQIPVDAHDLDLVTRIVNDGYRRFIGENPKWNFLNVPFSFNFVAQYSGTATSGSVTTLIDSSQANVYADNFFVGYGLRVTHADQSVTVYTITASTGTSGTLTFTSSTAVAAGDTYELAAATAVEGQNYRYYLPDDFYGILLTPFTYEPGGPRLTINVISESEMREIRAGANTSGTVSACTFRAVNTTNTSSGKRWEVMFWPSPNGTSRITAIYKRFPSKLTTGTDKSIAGFEHDDTILAACVAEAERQRGDKLQEREQMYQSKLAASVGLDQRATPTRSRDFGDRSEDRVGGGRPLNYYGVATYVSRAGTISF